MSEVKFAHHENGCLCCGRLDCECEAEARRELYPYLGGKMFWTYHEREGKRYRCLWVDGFDEILEVQWLT